MEKSHSHRPSQKQANKPFKSKHASKSKLKDVQKGRSEKSRTATAASSSLKPRQTNAMLSAAHNKVNRRNHAKQMQGKKHAALAEVGALFSRRGGDKVQRVIAVVPLTSDVNPLEMVQQLLQSVGVECQGEGAFRTGE